MLFFFSKFLLSCYSQPCSSLSLALCCLFFPPSRLFSFYRCCLLHRSTQLMHLSSSMKLSLQHSYLRNYILHWFFCVCKDSLSLDGLSPSRSPWWRWGCIAHLQFGSTSNCSAVLRVHIIYNQHLFGHCVILILCHSRNLLENQSMQNTFEQDNLELFSPFFPPFYEWMQQNHCHVNKCEWQKHTWHIQNNDRPCTETWASATVELPARSSLCHIPLVHSQSGVAAQNSKHGRWAFIKLLFSRSPPGFRLPTVCTKVIIPQASASPLKQPWHLKQALIDASIYLCFWWVTADKPGSLKAFLSFFFGILAPK